MITLQSIFLLILLCNQIFATTQIKRKAKVIVTNAEDVGSAHYAIIENLKTTLERKLPRNSHEFMHILAIELRDSLCDEDDYECEAMVYNHVLSGKSSDRKINTSADHISHFRSQLPNDFDYEVEMAMENTFTIISEMNNLGHEQALVLLYEQFEKLRKSETVVDEDHRSVGIASISVGIESLKQWKEVLNDPNHIFLKVPYVEYNAKMIHNKKASQENRNLQFDELLNALPEEFVNALSGVEFPDIDLGDAFNDINIGPVTEIASGFDTSDITGLVLNTADASGLNLVPIVSKDILGGSFGALVSLGRRKKKNGILRNGINLFCTATSAAVAGSVVGFFESLTQLLNPTTCA